MIAVPGPMIMSTAVPMNSAPKMRQSETMGEGGASSIATDAVMYGPFGFPGPVVESKTTPTNPAPEVSRSRWARGGMTSPTPPFRRSARQEVGLPTR